jgi:hypothetical protein
MSRTLQYRARNRVITVAACTTSSLGPGARLGRYELLIPIAHGGMARVWAACLHGQRGFSKLVAIKTILPHLAHSPEFERMFLDEAARRADGHTPRRVSLGRPDAAPQPGARQRCGHAERADDDARADDQRLRTAGQSGVLRGG